jgi:Zn-dependent protease with chaperone function
MSVDSKYYLHKSDKAALKALKSIPGFSKVTKAFMNMLYEKQWRIMNMSSNVRINEHQLSKYYDMLPPICEKLGIEIPEIYIDIDPYPNSYTYGDTKPFIVITSGLLETIPDELVPTVLAHECGHIACRHTLYTTMGDFILNASSFALSRLPFGSLISLPLQVAFYYWMRCSEYSADRAAAIVDGDGEKMAEVCMRLAGYDKDINFEANKDEFMKQAIEYREMIKDSKWNKTLEFMYMLDKSHPLTAIRALEVTEWSNSDTFKKIIDGTITDEDIEDDENTNNDGSKIVEEEIGEKKKKFEFPKRKKKESNSIEDIAADEKPSSDANELREFKALLDEGIITQEEFDAKKKEILNL